MSADQTPLDVEAIRAELAAMAGRPWTAEAAEYFIGRLLDENARLNTELAARDRTIEALSARLTAKNAELDKVIREAAADKARIAELEELKCAVCGMRVAHLNSNGHVIGWGCADGEECKPAPEMPSAFDGAPPIRTNVDGSQSYGPYAAPEMPRPPAEEADALAKHEAAIAEYVRACKADGCSCYPIASNTKVISHWCRIHGVLSIVPAELTWTNPGIRGGEPCMRGTRVPVEQVCTLLEDGATWDFVKETYPSIPTPEGTRGAAQEPVSGPETAGTGSGRGTGVTEAPGAKKAERHWLKFNNNREITGCSCGFKADLDSDCGWGDSAVGHLVAVGHAEEAAALKESIRLDRLPSLPVPSTERPRDA